MDTGGRIFLEVFLKNPYYVLTSDETSCKINYVARRFTSSYVERWPSGRRRTPGKCVSGKLDHGFKSHPLRHYRARRGVSGAL